MHCSISFVFFFFFFWFVCPSIYLAIQIARSLSTPLDSDNRDCVLSANHLSTEGVDAVYEPLQFTARQFLSLRLALVAGHAKGDDHR